MRIDYYSPEDRKGNNLRGIIYDGLILIGYMSDSFEFIPYTTRMNIEQLLKVSHLLYFESQK